MSKIILASQSPQRKKLLKRLGFKFIVKPSHAKELKKIKSTCAKLVMDNALIKAQDVAKKMKKGIVIGADTLGYGGGKVIGKPKNLSHAKKILKLLGSRPHWIYTGVALVDAESGKKMVGYEKTKIFMNKLTDKEIDRYHKQVSPLDKAGGFDIEGHGGLFIRRIEGCYYNVIGLPLAKLCAMLKKFGVHVLSVLMMLTAAGCHTEFNLATGREERLLYGTEKEVKIGNAVAQKFNEHFTINTEVDVNERVQKIFDRIVAVSDRKDIVYFVSVIDEDKKNAVSLPGGHVYLFKGIIDLAENDDQIAGVLAHEVGHITAKHGMKRLQNAYGHTLLKLAAYGTQNYELAKGVDAAFTSMFYAHSQEAEHESDKLAVKYLRKAGYDPAEMVTFLKRLREHQLKEPLRKYGYWRTHPNINQRIAVVNKEVHGKMGFKDYLNLVE